MAFLLSNGKVIATFAGYTLTSQEFGDAKYALVQMDASGNFMVRSAECLNRSDVTKTDTTTPIADQIAAFHYKHSSVLDLAEPDGFPTPYGYSKERTPDNTANLFKKSNVKLTTTGTTGTGLATTGGVVTTSGVTSFSSGLSDFMANPVAWIQANPMTFILILFVLYVIYKKMTSDGKKKKGGGILDGIL